MVDVPAISQKVVQIYQKVFGSRLYAVYLFGSYARGDYHDGSDIDYFAVVDEDELTIKNTLDALYDTTYDLNLSYNVVISPLVSSKSEYEQDKTIDPLYKNIAQEGVLLYG